MHSQHKVLNAIILTIILVHIFLLIVRYVFVSCNRSAKSAVFKTSLSVIFHTIDDFLIFQESFQLPFFDSEKRGIFYSKFQVFCNGLTCFSIAAPPYSSICHKCCFTKLLTFIFCSFFSGILLSYNCDQIIH